MWTNHVTARDRSRDATYCIARSNAVLSVGELNFLVGTLSYIRLCALYKDYNMSQIGASIKTTPGGTICGPDC